MGGASTEIGEAGEGGTIDVLLEAAHFDPAVIARAARRHKLPSEASRRFERAVDPQLPPVAAERAAQLLVEHGGGTHRRRPHRRGRAPRRRRRCRMPLELPDRVAGVAYARGATVRRLQQVGCRVELDTGTDGHGVVVATPPSWRPDLAQPADLVEEVLRLEGYDTIPSVLPPAPPGRGLTPRQLRRRAVSRALAEAGYVEVLPFPFVGAAVWDAFGLPADDVRRRTVRVLNPLDADRPALATTLLPGLLDTLVRNRARGFADLALHAVEQVVLPHTNPVADAGPGRRRTGRPTPRSRRSRPRCRPSRCTWGWCSPATASGAAGGARDGRPAGRTRSRSAGWSGAAAGVELRVTTAALPPWHPGRCAALRVGDWVVGHAGELHPKVVEALGLPPRTCAMELDLDALPLRDARPAPRVSPYPPISVDVALVAAGRRAGGRRWPTPSSTAAGAAGGGAAVRRLHRRAGRRGAALAGVRAAVPRPGPHADQRGGQRRPRRRGRRGRGAARGDSALTRATVRRAAGRARPAPRRARPRPVASAPGPPA